MRASSEEIENSILVEMDNEYSRIAQMIQNNQLNHIHSLPRIPRANHPLVFKKDNQRYENLTLLYPIPLLPLNSNDSSTPTPQQTQIVQFKNIENG